MKHLVIGAGPSGLFAAWCLQLQGEDVEVWEASETLGGWAQTLPWPGRDGQPGALDRGPQNLMWRPSSTLDQLLQEQKHPFEFCPAKPRWILKQGKQHPLPWGLAWLRSELLSRRARLRMLLEPLQPRSPFEESLKEFIARRLGPAFAQEILPALSASLLAAPPETIDAAALPILLRMEAQGGLARAALRQCLHKSLHKNVDRRIIPKGGVGGLMQHMASGLKCRTRMRALALEPLPGGRWRAITQDASAEADRIHLALPAFEAAPLLAPHASQAAEVLEALPYRNLINWHSRHASDAHLASGFSLLMDPSESMGILGCTALGTQDFRSTGQVQVRTTLPAEAGLDGDSIQRFLHTHLPGLGPPLQIRQEAAPRAIPNPAPGQISRLQEARLSLPPSLSWIGVPRFGAGIVETYEGIRAGF